MIVKAFLNPPYYGMFTKRNASKKLIPKKNKDIKIAHLGLKRFELLLKQFLRLYTYIIIHHTIVCKKPFPFGYFL